MKISFRNWIILPALLALSTLNSQLSTARAQGTTAFTYQGRLNTGTNAANGSYDMTFAIYDADVGGNLIAGPITNSAVAVSNGLFTVTLDFGSGVFTGTNYWVQMAVSPAGANTFASLVPRQQLTPAPYSISLMAPQSYALCPPGSIMAYMGTNAPPGWLLCDGTAYPTNQYPTLFAVIGSSCGASGTTFNVPDCRGIFLRGVNGTRIDSFADPGDGRININPGGNTGNAVGSYQQDMFKSHSHSLSRANGVASGGNLAIQTPVSGAIDQDASDILSVGATGGSETRSKNIYVNYIIKY
jgi:microcystin-dependent protein